MSKRQTRLTHPSQRRSVRERLDKTSERLIRSDVTSKIPLALPPVASPMVDFQAIDRWPEGPELRIIGTAISGYLFALFEARISGPDATNLKNWRAGKSIEPEIEDKLYSAFDEMLLQQARSLGPRLLLSPDVFNRVLHWFRTGAGPEKLARLGAEMEAGARSNRGERGLPTDEPELYPLRKELIDEVSLLGTQLRRIGVTDQQSLLDTIKGSILNSQSAFPRLWQNISSFLAYLTEHRSMLSNWITGTIRATGLVQEWMGWARSRDPESLRQDISRLGSQVRS